MKLMVLLLSMFTLIGCTKRFEIPSPHPLVIEGAFNRCGKNAIKSATITQDVEFNGDYVAYISVTCEIGITEATFKIIYTEHASVH